MRRINGPIKSFLSLCRFCDEAGQPYTRERPVATTMEYPMSADAVWHVDVAVVGIFSRSGVAHENLDHVGTRRRWGPGEHVGCVPGLRNAPDACSGANLELVLGR